jgi:ligand-binding sensor domain-containing protein
MKAISIFVFFIIVISSNAQTEQWSYFRPTNSGVATEEHYFISEDAYGNIWTGGRSAIQGEGAVVKYNHLDNIFTCWSNFEGYIPSQHVNGVDFDENGFLWVATADGLCKYDGWEWITYDMTNTSLPSANIRSVSIDSNNAVWIGFQEINMNIGGLAKFENNTWQIFTMQNSNLPAYTVREVLVDTQDVVWIRTENEVSKFDGSSFTNYNYQNSEVGIQIYDIEVDEMNRLYVVSSGPFYNEIDILENNIWSTMNSANTPILNGQYPFSINVRGDKIILASSGSGFVVLIYDGSEWSTHISGDVIFDVFIDHNDEFWVAGLTTLSHLTGGEWKDYMRHSAGLGEHHSYDIFIDSANRLWSANGNGGIQVLDCPRWESYGPYNQGLFPSPQTLSSVGASTCEDSEGNIWFAFNSTDGTVVKIPGGDYQNYDAWEVFDLSNSPVSWVESSGADGFGNVFFYSDYGVHMYNNTSQEWTTWDVSNSSLQYNSYSIARDLNGKIYFGGFQQISVFDNGVWSSVDLSELNAEITAVNDIDFDSANRMWLATEEGLWCYDNISWLHWTSSDETFHSNHVTSVSIDQNDKVYVSSYLYDGFLQGGIARFANDEWENWSMENSELPGEQIDDIEIDGFGNLWINTFGQGITLFNPEGIIGIDCVDHSIETNPVLVENDLINNSSLLVYPNPVQDELNIRLNGLLPESATVTITDGTGRTVMICNIEGLQKRDGGRVVNTSSLAEGAYHGIISNSSKAISFQFVK